MKKQVIFEQGDVCLIPCKEVSGEKLKTNVIQEGEHTGHAHRITSGKATIFGSGNVRSYLRVAKGGATITHEEHLPVKVPEGDYEVKIVRQKDPFTKLIAPVLD